MKEKRGSSASWYRLLSAARVGERLGLSRSHVYTLAAAGELPSIKLRGAVRFEPEDIETFIREHRRGIPPAA